MNELQVFNNPQFGDIRTVEQNGKIYFCGSDVARALGYANARDALNRHCNTKGVAKHDTLTSGGKQLVTFIDEGNLYRLITHSKLPAAEQFETWVFDEVLPTIRKTGGYVASDDLFISTYLSHADEQTKTLFKTTLATINNLNARIESDRPKVLFSEAVSASSSSILIGELAKILRQNGCEIGQNRLFQWLRDNGYLMKGGSSYNMPTQRAMELGLFQVKETTISNPDGSIRVTATTKVTGKGQVYFINKFITSSLAICRMGGGA